MQDQNYVSIFEGVTLEDGVFIGPHACLPHTLVYGNPAHPHGYVCHGARSLTIVHQEDGVLLGWCETCTTMRVLR